MGEQGPRLEKEGVTYKGLCKTGAKGTGRKDPETADVFKREEARVDDIKSAIKMEWLKNIYK